MENSQNQFNRKLVVGETGIGYGVQMIGEDEFETFVDADSRFDYKHK